MSLSKEEVKNLLAYAEQKSKRGGKRKIVDHRVRDLPTWFLLKPSSFTDGSLTEYVKCENPNCTDDRPPKKTSTGKEIKVQACAEINGVKLCRRCFLNGWLLENPAQEQIA